MKKFFSAAALGLALASQGAFAHGPAKAQHGGIVQSSSDLSFELVPQANGAVIYVVDHDDPADVSKMGGKLTVLNGSDRSEADLKPSGPDTLVATGVKIGAGSKVVASITGASSKTVTVRFTVK